MNSFQNVFSACVDEQLLESGGKIETWTSLSFLWQERGPKNICSKIAQQTVDGAFLQSKTTYEVTKALFIFGGENYKQGVH